MARACFPMFPSFQDGKYCFQCRFLFSRCKLCLRYTTGNFNENSSMRALAKLLRARGSEHTSNFCEQFEQRPNFASAYKLWDHSIPLTHTCTCREASTLEKLKTRQSLVSLDLCLKKSGLENPTTIVCSSFSKPQSKKQSNASIMWTAHQIWIIDQTCSVMLAGY